MAVHDLEARALSDTGGGAERWTAVVTVQVRGSGGAEVAGATVTGAWSGSALGLVSARTGEDGRVRFALGGLQGDQRISFSVVEILHHDYVYLSDLDRAKIITVPPPSGVK
ncbi:MAG: Ig-like domain-containing protein [Actinomycetota bacterium]|nr:Ig-like domain-containing protein [Actinomycetota bacterium]